MKTLLQSAAAAMLIAISSAAFADPMLISDPNLPGNKQADNWTNFTLTLFGSPGHGSFPGTSAWASGPLNSTTPIVGTDGDASIVKLGNGTGGGPFLGAQGIYHGGISDVPNTLGGTLGVRDTTPIANVKNIVLQIQFGEAFGRDLYNDVFPVLNYNGGSQAVPATHALTLESYDTGEVFEAPTGSEPIFTNTYLLQWDTTLLGSITDFTVTFSTVQHGQIYQVRLDQSDVFAPIPEPGSVVLAGLGLLGIVGLAWKKRRS